ncbi:putative conserved secreted protein [Synechococcus sp. A15-62]|nr:putative conserved secreted protein [Synechococcus sp. A15-62]
MRFALSLGMLLGMSHGWVTAEALQQQPMQGFDSIETVNSATQFNPFSSRSHQFFPY